MAGSRVLVHQDVAEALTTRIVERARRIKLGDPMLPDTEMGPVANERQFETVNRHFAYAVEDGATVAYGGKADPDLGGLFVEPTVLTEATLGMRSVSEEIFGPVVAVTAFADEAEAIALANGTDFGLAGCGLDERHPARPSRRGARCERERFGSTLTASLLRRFRSAASDSAAGAARTVPTQSSTTPRTSRSGSS